MPSAALFALTDRLSIYGQAIVGEAVITQKGNQGIFPNHPAGVRAFTIYSGNPFLPPAILPVRNPRYTAGALQLMDLIVETWQRRWAVDQFHFVSE